MSTVRASITIEPGPGEDLADLVAEALHRLEGLGGGTAVDAVDYGSLAKEQVTAPAATASETWTGETCARVVSGMTSEGRAALRYMCENGPTVSFADMMRAQGLDPTDAGARRVMGGRLSSFGHNLNRLPRPPENPTQNATGDYKAIDPEAMAPFLAALDRYDAEQPSEH